jgi:hypothetical protein
MEINKAKSTVVIIHNRLHIIITCVIYFFNTLLASIEFTLATITSLLAIYRNWIYSDYNYIKWLKRDLKDCDSILELGCGLNSQIIQIGYGKKTDATDIYRPYVEIHNNKDDYNLCLQDNITNGIGFDKKYDAVVLLDVLEHLKREDVEKTHLLAMVEQMALKKVIVLSPNGEVSNDLSDGNPYQKHQSAWYPNEFEQRGYEVHGAIGLKYLLTTGSRPAYRPYRLFEILSILTQPFVFYHPEIAGSFYAVKERK